MIDELGLKALEKILNDVYTDLNKIKFNNELPPLPVIPVTGAEFLGSCRATNGRPTQAAARSGNTGRTGGRDPARNDSRVLLYSRNTALQPENRRAFARIHKGSGGPRIIL